MSFGLGPYRCRPEPSFDFLGKLAVSGYLRSFELLAYAWPSAQKCVPIVPEDSRERCNPPLDGALTVEHQLLRKVLKATISIEKQKVVDPERHAGIRLAAE